MLSRRPAVRLLLLLGLALGMVCVVWDDSGAQGGYLNRSTSGASNALRDPLKALSDPAEVSETPDTVELLYGGAADDIRPVEPDEEPPPPVDTREVIGAALILLFLLVEGVRWQRRGNR
ncbi:MAG: hypothetical protein FJZ47_04075 [Candidatus Tectomicrobia bacterium]|uniref:Uncharacterized protein n=1 Tax=Tectimicrobiota bacterium TaxID=2528274 RepID=A0A937VYP4_UNCTE|nr:hypothetical protein [Candidatus Tectomicrobia bacterium]